MSPTAPERDAHKRQRRTGDIAEEVFKLPIIPRLRVPTSLNEISIVCHGGVACAEVSPHGTEGSRARRATPEADDVSAKAHADLVHEVRPSP